MKAFIYKIGATPARSSRFFWSGLIAFWLGALVMWYGVDFWMGFYYLGLAIVIPAFITAAYGYIGIFANRYAQVIKFRERFKDLK